MTLHPAPGHALTLHALTVALLVTLAVLLGTVLLHLLFHRVVRRQQQPALCVARFLRVHLALAVLGGALALLVLVFTVAHGVGALFNRHLHIPPSGAEVHAGSAAPPRASLARYLPPVLDQGQTAACGAFAASEALYAERSERGEQMGTTRWSPYFDYYYAAGGRDAATTLDQEAGAYIAHGVVPWDAQTQEGLPLQEEIALALGQGGSYYYLFYAPQGQAGLEAIKGEIAHGHPVILLIAVNQDFEDAVGAASTNNGGAFTGGYHFVVAYGYDGNTFFVRNSWGADWGQGGNILFTPQAMLNTVYAAGVMLPGAPAWPLPAPPPAPSAIPVGPPTPTAVVPGPALALAGPLPPRIVMVRKQDLRDRPRADSGRRATLYPGWVLMTTGQQTPHWLVARTLNRRAQGWVLKTNSRVPK